MALEEQTTIDKIEIDAEFGTITVRDCTTITRDGEQIAKTFHRTPYDCDSEGAPQIVADIGAVVWAPAVVARYNERKERIAKENELLAEQAQQQTN